MEVIKRDGRIQKFDMGKIIITLQNASDEAGAPMNDSDINVITENIEDALQKEGINRIHVKDIQDLVINTLLKNGFNDVAEYYASYKK